MGNRSLSANLLAGFALVAVGPIVVLSLVHAATYARSTEADHLQRLQEAAASSSARIERRLEAERRAVVAFAHALAAEGDFSPAGLHRAVHQTLAAQDALWGLLVIDDHGRIAAFAVARAEELPGSLIGADVSDRGYFREVVAGRPWYISEVFLGRPDRNPIVAVSAPARDRDGRLWVVQASVRLASLASLDRGIEQLPQSRLVVTDARGLVAHASPSAALQPLRPLVDAPLWKAGQGGAGPFEVDEAGTLYAVGRARGPQGWSVFVEQPADLIRREAHRYYWFTLAVALLATLATLPLVRWLSGGITRPLERLSAALEAFVGGGPARAVRVPVPDQSPREVEALVSGAAEVTARLDKVLTGLLPICQNCKKVRDEEQRWTRIEEFLVRRTEANFSHGLCQECATRLYPE